MLHSSSLTMTVQHQHVFTRTASMLFPGELCVLVKPYGSSEAINVHHVIEVVFFT